MSKAYLISVSERVQVFIPASENCSRDTLIQSRQYEFFPAVFLSYKEDSSVLGGLIRDGD